MGLGILQIFTTRFSCCFTAHKTFAGLMPLLTNSQSHQKSGHLQNFANKNKQIMTKLGHFLCDIVMTKLGYFLCRYAILSTSPQQKSYTPSFAVLGWCSGVATVWRQYRTIISQPNDTSSCVAARASNEGSRRLHEKAPTRDRHLNFTSTFRV